MLIGNTKSGKTESIYNILKNHDYKVLDRLEFHNIYIISPTVHLDDTMSKIKDLLKDYYPKLYNEDHMYEDVV